jgi:hypothetical protein
MVHAGTVRAAVEGQEGEVVSWVESFNVADSKLTGFVSLFESDSNLFFGKIFSMVFFNAIHQFHGLLPHLNFGFHCFILNKYRRIYQ